MQFKAGYIIDSIAQVINQFRTSLDKHKPADRIQLDKINGLLQHVSSFDVEFPGGYSPDYTAINPVLAILNNIITRGLPTRSPVFLETLFSEINLTEPSTDEFEFNFPNSTKSISYEGIFELLHIIEPQLEINKHDYGGSLGSDLEWEFLKKHPFLKQILQSQRDFATINAKLQGGRTVDFCFSSPYLHWNELKNRYERIERIIEVDGHQRHFLSEGRFYDSYRDASAGAEGFKTTRLTSEDIRQDNTAFDALFGRAVYQNFKNNFEKDIREHLLEYSLVFIPLAVARVQKTIIECFLIESELSKKKKIEIAVIERDLPCGAVAIKMLQDLFFNVNEILDDKDKLPLPEISLTIFTNSKWLIHNKLHLEADVKDDQDHFQSKTFDIIIDHSILRRSNIYNEPDYNQHKEKTVRIRSSHYFDTAVGIARRVYCAQLVNYKSLVRKSDNGSYVPIAQYERHINFFIQTIFRKVGFREGQLPIISRALQQKPVIGLLPTGGGKSLTFQLPSFLQPGLCLVVDPIKSLMQDQVRVLKDNWIDCCEFINSTLKRQERQKRLGDFHHGETMFLFIAPERLVMDDFRNIVHSIGSSIFGLAFSYCVIDEVHCVSEWGHDFRTTYLMLGKNAQKFVTTRSGKEVSLIGLTATASFDVLTDIERELGIISEDVHDAVISIDNTIRPELFFSVVENHTRPADFPVTSQNLKDTIGSAKQRQINQYIEGIVGKLKSINEEVVTECLKQHFNDFELNQQLREEEGNNYLLKIRQEILKQKEVTSFSQAISIIFCPHTTGSFGITQAANPFPRNRELFENLTVPIENKGYFMGGDDKIKKVVSENAQQYFSQFMQGKINYMICTKAFGMGIDKEHIRSVYHINFSSSPESYIQEAGRAGRDKGKSICTIFLDRNIYYKVGNNFIDQHRLKLPADRKKARELCEEYSGFQNRILEKYFGDPASIIQSFKAIGIDIDEQFIIPFNQDLSIHEYFHTNSFKGEDTENYQLKRFINYKEGLNTTQLIRSQEKYNLEFDDDVNFNLTRAGDYRGNMLINDSKGHAIGKIFTARERPTVTIKGLPTNQDADLFRSQQVLDFLIEEWRMDGKEKTVLFNFLEEEFIKGLNSGRSLLECFENTDKGSFWFQVPTFFKRNNLETRLIEDFGLTKLPIIDADKTTEEFLTILITYSANFEDFILRLEENWDVDIIGNPLYIQGEDQYRSLYFSEINTADVSKMIYRLYSIGLVEDYKVDYNLGIFSIEVLKREKHYYINKTQDHLLKYLSRTVTLQKVEALTASTKELSAFETIRKCVEEILQFTYADIVKKRKDAVNDLFTFITESCDLSKQKANSFTFTDFWYNHHFKDEMYYYFNAKYARVGFKVHNKPYSLLDDTEKGRISNWETFEKYATILNDQTSFISECKMMRGSCRRIWRTLYKDDNEREYTLKLLASYATFGLNNKFYYQEAEDLFIEGFSIYYSQHQNYNLLKSRVKIFERHLLDSTSNEGYLPYLTMAKHKIMLKVNLEFALNINQQLQETL